MYDSAHCLLQLQWLALSPMHLAKDCLLDALRLVQRQGVQRVLLNLDGMPELSALDAYLLETNLLLALPALSVQQVALVLTSYMQHQLLLESSLRQPPFDIQVFDDAETALDWLQQSAMLPAPLSSGR
ncbi:hypothetical protein [Hymenobacter sp. DG01]|uniref:hypothetical protein n=1 Tax=Hymenobacter sp. DG01 TaxID=2584940 RepID=UPI001121E9F5|nr:hypothetical protein [Hymenobacter sp. DG01]